MLGRRVPRSGWMGVMASVMSLYCLPPAGAEETVRDGARVQVPVPPSQPGTVARPTAHAEASDHATSQLPPELRKTALDWATVVQFVETHHPALQAFGQRRAASALEAGTAAFLPDPKAGFGLEDVPVHLDGLPLMFEVQQDIPLHGRLGIEADMKKIEGKMLTVDQEMLRRELLGQLRQTFAQYRRADASAQVMATVIPVLDGLQMLSQQRYETGQGMRMDVLRVVEQRARMETDRLEMLRDREMAQVRLTALLGLPATTQLPPVKVENVPKPTLTLESLLSRALTQQPLLQQEALKAEEATLALKLAETAYAPELMVRASYMLDPMQMDMWSLGAMVEVPLYSRKRQQPRIDAARKRLQATTSQLQAQRQTLEGEVAMMRLQLETASQHVQLHDQRLIPLAEQMLETSRAAYETGQGSLKDVLEALSMLRMHHLERERFVNDWLEVLSRLERMTGPLDEVLEQEVPR